jgi:sugar lactone lactonase YvrE
MKTLTVLTLAATLVLTSCSTAQKKEYAEGIDKKTIGLLPTEKEPELIKVAEFKGVQVTGVTIAPDGRMFANFPRWRKNVPFSVVELSKDGNYKPFPDKEWNDWKGKPENNKFTCVQSVVAHGNSLFVLDPASPNMEGVVGKAMLYEFDLTNNKLANSWSFDSDVAPKKSYLNDVRIDDAANKAYITDSGLGGIVVLDLGTGKASRVLDDHPSTKSERVILSVEKKPFLLRGAAPKIHSDGIALDEDQNRLYWHALTGYHLYSVPTDVLHGKMSEEKIEEKVSNMGVTPAPDGMIFDENGNLYMADLERNAVSYRTPAGEMKILIQDERIKWPDTFAIDDKNNLIFTDSLLQASPIGEPVDDMTYSIYKVSLPDDPEKI